MSGHRDVPTLRDGAGYGVVHIHAPERLIGSRFFPSGTRRGGLRPPLSLLRAHPCFSEMGARVEAPDA